MSIASYLMSDAVSVHLNTLTLRPSLSVTRLGDFRKFLAIHFLVKVAQISNDVLANLKISLFKGMTIFKQPFGRQLGYFVV